MYCNVCNKYRRFQKTKISNTFKKTLGISIVYTKYVHKYETIFKEEESIEILKIIGLINNIQEHHIWKKVNLTFRLKKMDEIRNFWIEEINQNKLMNRKHDKVCRVFNYIVHLLILISTVPGCVTISALLL